MFGPYDISTKQFVAAATVFPKFQKTFGPPHDLMLLWIVLNHEFLGHALILDDFLKITFRPGFQILEFVFAELKMDQTICPLQNTVSEEKQF